MKCVRAKRGNKQTNNNKNSVVSIRLTIPSSYLTGAFILLARTTPASRSFRALTRNYKSNLFSFYNSLKLIDAWKTLYKCYIPLLQACKKVGRKRAKKEFIYIIHTHFSPKLYLLWVSQLLVRYKWHRALKEVAKCGCKASVVNFFVSRI